MNEAIILGARDWLLVAAITTLAISTLAIWSYAHRSASRYWTNWLAMLLKIVAGGALAFCLLEPMRRSERPRPGANIMAIMVDNSRSMEIHPPGQAVGYLERFKQALHSDAAWQVRLAQDFDMRHYACYKRLRSFNDLA